MLIDISYIFVWLDFNRIHESLLFLKNPSCKTTEKMKKIMRSGFLDF